MIASKLTLDTALLPTGWARHVRVSIDDEGWIVGVSTGTETSAETSATGGPSTSRRIRGATIPGIPNVHSHAHQRAMVGLAERSGPASSTRRSQGSHVDSFWTWREVMYGFLGQMTPDDLETIAAQLYVEMLKAGFTAVGEFQYLHHDPGGQPYGELAEMTLRCHRASRRAGIGFTALPVLYAHGDFGGQSPTPGQRRFLSGADRFLALADQVRRALGDDPDTAMGIAPHSLRAVSPELLQAVLAGTPEAEPVHLHISEQQKEVDDCVAWSRQRPVDWLLDHGDVGPRWCLIHATHMTPTEARRLAGTGAVVGLCPTTEANLGDGIFPAPDYLDGAMAIGSDSHISVSPAEDLRQLEYGQRLRDQRRNVLAVGPAQSTGRTLVDRVLGGGARALGRPVGALAPGHRADFVVLDTDHPTLAGPAAGDDPDDLLDGWIFSAGNACVRDVWVGGRAVIEDRHHPREEEILHRFRSTLRRLRAAS